MTNKLGSSETPFTVLYHDHHHHLTPIITITIISIISIQTYDNNENHKHDEINDKHAGPDNNFRLGLHSQVDKHPVEVISNVDKSLFIMKRFIERIQKLFQR